MLLAQPRRNLHALGAGIERNVEMMLARQAVLGGVLEHVAHHTAQRILGEEIVADVVDGHDRELAADGDSHRNASARNVESQLERAPEKRKWGLLLPGAPEPRLTLLRRQGFRSVYSNRLRGLSNRSIVVVGNYGLAR